MKYLVFLILLLMPTCLQANSLSYLQEFMRPSGNQLNIYGCNFPCEKIQTKGIFSEGDNKLIIEEKTLFSDKICKENGIPCESISKYTIFMTEESLSRENKSGSSVIIKLPLEKSNQWEIKTIQTNGNYNNNYLCTIVDINKLNVFGMLRTIVTTECYSDFTKEMITTKYASGLGLLERTSYVTNNSGEKILIHKMVLEDSKTE